MNRHKQSLAAGIAFAIMVSTLGCPNQPASIRQARNLVRQWQPPSKQMDQKQFFASEVANFKLTSSRDTKRLETFDFDGQGWHAVYARDADNIEVFFFWDVDEQMREQLHENATALIHKKGPNHSEISSAIGNWQLICADGDRYRFFLKNGWLAVFKSGNNLDSITFAEAFVTATQDNGNQSN